jgi:hypothetical protein
LLFYFHLLGTSFPIILFSPTTLAQCYDFLNIFAEKFLRKNWRFWLENKAKFWKKLIITMVFKKNANFLPKIGKNRRKLWS